MGGRTIHRQLLPHLTIRHEEHSKVPITRHTKDSSLAVPLLSSRYRRPFRLSSGRQSRRLPQHFVTRILQYWLT